MREEVGAGDGHSGLGERGRGSRWIGEFECSASHGERSCKVVLDLQK